MTGFSLYKLSNEFQTAINDAYQTDEITLDQVDALNSLTGSIEDKAINIASLIKNLEAESETVSSAAKEMMDRSKKIDTKIEMLSNYLKNNLEACKINEITKSPYFKIKIKENPASVLIENEKLINPIYLARKTTFAIDKLKIKEDLKNGKIVVGAILNKTTRLEIK